MIDSTLWKERLVVFFLACLTTSFLHAQSEVHRTDNLIPDGGLVRIEHSNGYTMLSGGFSAIGPYSGGAALTDLVAGTTIDATFPKVNGDVYLVVPDGTGGWYLGGYFDAVDTVKIINLVHIKSDKSVDRAWKPNPDNSPTAIKIDGTTLYVGGYFNSIAGQTRNYLASFNLTTGALNAWNPNPNNAVQALEVTSGIVYVGGYFSNIGGLARTGLAAVNASTGAVITTWVPALAGLSYTVRSLAFDATSLYIGGSFTAVNGFPRVNMARVSLAAGAALLPFVANTNNYVSKIRLSGTTLFACGGFNTINGISRFGLASMNATSGVVLSWNPGLTVSNSVDDFSISGNTIYFCGYFDAVSAIPRNSVAAIDITTAALVSWAPNPNSSVYSIYASTANVVVGGYMNGMNWENRSQAFALLDESTGSLWPFEFDLNGGVVNTIAVKDEVLYIGGQFTAINKTQRRNLAAFDLTTGDLMPWNPNVFGISTTDPAVTVYNMQIKDNLLYIAGKFYAVNAPGTVRPGLAAIDVNTGTVNNWNPAVGDGKTTDQYVNSIDISGNTVYAGGNFSLLSGNQSRGNLAAIDATSGAILPWNPVSNGLVDKIRVTATTAYVVGEFGNGVGGAIRIYRIAALNLNANTATSWNPTFVNGGVNDIAIGGSDLYVGGYYDSVNVVPRPGLASFDVTTGNVNDWNPDAGSNSDGGYNINSLTTSGSKLSISGSFEYLGLENRNSYGEYCILKPLITLDGSTLSVAASGSLQWYENGVAVPGATTQDFEINPLEYGVYAVTVSGGGCAARSDDFIYLITETEIVRSQELKVYPNPVQDELIVQLAPSSGTVNFTLRDMMGRTIKTIQGHGGKHTLSLRDIDSGPYLLTIQTSGQKQVQKIIKVR